MKTEACYVGGCLAGMWIVAFIVGHWPFGMPPVWALLPLGATAGFGILALGFFCMWLAEKRWGQFG